MIEANNKDKKFTILQFLRGFAALSVVLFHYRFYIRGTTDDGIRAGDFLFSWGVIGVDIFFVISGFIIMITTQKYPPGLPSFKKFIFNRAVRILPMYFFGLLIAFFLFGGFLYFNNQEKINDLLSAISFTVYNNNIKPHYINDDSFYNVRWTLNYEIYFYISFAICLFFTRKFFLILLWCLLSVCIIPITFGFNPTLSTQGYNFTSATMGLITNPMVIEFILGVIIGKFYIALRAFSLNQTITVIILTSAIITSIVLVLGFHNNYIHALNIKSATLISIIILLLVLIDSKIEKYIPKAFTKLGDISFSLYLLHNPIGIAIFTACGLYGDTFLKGYPAILLAICISIIASTITHRFIEIKLSTFIKKHCKNIINGKRKSQTVS